MGHPGQRLRFAISSFHGSTLNACSAQHCPGGPVAQIMSSVTSCHTVTLLSLVGHIPSLISPSPPSTLPSHRPVMLLPPFMLYVSSHQSLFHHLLSCRCHCHPQRMCIKCAFNTSLVN
jgi:hypothetical protein